MSIASELKNRVWQRDNQFISTDASLIPLPTLQEAFASPVFYWANPLPDAALEETLQNSLCFGLYEGQHPPKTEEGAAKQPRLVLLGFARGVTDFTTFFYLTDVWVEPTQQGKGLGRWMMQCVDEILKSMPFLRRSMLLTGSWDKSVPFYEEVLGMELMDTTLGHGLAVGRGHPDYKGDETTE